MHSNDQEFWTCPICGWPRLRDDPRRRIETICACCGTQFTTVIFDDEFDEIRDEWVEKGMPFHFSEREPAGWDPRAQLRAAGLPVPPPPA